MQAMRVIAGTVKGLHLKSPRSKATRPATDLVRGALFSVLESMDISWNRVLDLFAGTGALGIEALSRRASWVDFVEQNIKACNLIKENLAHGGFAESSHVYCSNVSAALNFLKGPYDLILMDPPYHNSNVHTLLLKLSLTNLLLPKGILSIIHSSRVPLNQSYGNLLLIKQRKHGDSTLSIFQKEGSV
jgi:16S rRNA (guanine966-N2)-methyltransferase